MSPPFFFSLSLLRLPAVCKDATELQRVLNIFFLSPSCFYVSISEIPITSVLLDCSGDFPLLLPFSLINLGGCDRWRPSFLFLRRRQSLSRASGLSPSLRDGNAKKKEKEKKDDIPLIFPAGVAPSRLRRLLTDDMASSHDSISRRSR